jgi:ferredoxin-NADP reductase
MAVARVVAETADAASIVMDVPDDLREAFAYEPGQFCTFRVHVGGEALLRCYSMSSTPGVDDDLRVTVKRVPGGVVSNWLLDQVGAGTELELTRPAGVFQLAAGESALVAFAAGSGITPVYSLVKAALHEGSRPVRLLYANRDRDSVIFHDELAALAERFPGRLEVVHHLDVESGFVDTEQVRAFLRGGTCGDPGATGGAGHYLCGPAPFMDVVEAALLDAGVPAGRIHVERFVPAAEPSGAEGAQRPAAAERPAGAGGSARAGGSAAACRVTIELDGRRNSTDHHPGTTILQTARQLGMSPPFSCESGSCATCMARVLEGSVEMFVNDALTDDELEEGWILTCQSVPTSPAVSVVYGYEEA